MSNETKSHLADSSTNPAAVKKKKSPRPGWMIALIIVQLALLFLIIAGGIWLYHRTQSAIFDVTYKIPGQEDIVHSYFYGETAELEADPEIDGYTFLGWEDKNGNIEDQTEFPVYRNLTYTASFAMQFETKKHISYLSLTDEGVFNVDGPVTNGEAVSVIYKLLNTKLTGKGSFLDVSKEDDCYKAAATLKDLGVISGSRLHPDEVITRGDFLKMICSFFPQSRETFKFADIDSKDDYYPYFCTAAANGWIESGAKVEAAPLEELTRGTFAHIMNRVLGRDTEKRLTIEDVGTVLDVPFSNDYFEDVAEAAIPHEYKLVNDREVWTSSEPLPIHEPGYFYAGVRLHYIDEEGVPASDTVIDGLYFNKNGEVSTGNDELDHLLWAAMEEEIDPNTMTQEEMLKVMYDYVVKSFSYQKGNIYEVGAEGWDVAEAYKMMTTKKGNCYSYAATFYEFARFVGYDAKLFSGVVFGDQQVFYDEEGELIRAPEGLTPHGWVEIEFNGKYYIFDTEYEYRSNGYLKMFKRGDNTRNQWGYTTNPQG